MADSCEKCRFWGAERAHDYNHPYGTCRRRSPDWGTERVLPYHDPDRPEAAGPLILLAKWIWTAFDDWCGEFQVTLNKRPTRGSVSAPAPEGPE